LIYRTALEEAFEVMNEIYSELGLNPKDLVHDGGIIPNPVLFQCYTDGVLRLYISQKISNERSQKDTRDIKKDSRSDSSGSGRDETISRPESASERINQGKRNAQGKFDSQLGRFPFFGRALCPAIGFRGENSDAARNLGAD